jgi:hypothetical protein
MESSPSSLERPEERSAQERRKIPDGNEKGEGKVNRLLDEKKKDKIRPTAVNLSFLLSYTFYLFRPLSLPFQREKRERDDGEEVGVYGKDLRSLPRDSTSLRPGKGTAGRKRDVTNP